MIFLNDFWFRVAVDTQKKLFDTPAAFFGFYLQFIVTKINLPVVVSCVDSKC